MIKQLFKITQEQFEAYRDYGILPMAGGAVEDKYVDADLVAGKKSEAIDMAAGQLYVGIATFEVAAADEDGSIYRIFKSVDASLIPVSMRLSCDAITGMSDVDCGLYDTNGGAVVDKDCLADALNPSAGYTRILGLDCLKDVDLALVKSRLWQHVSGLTLNTKKGSYDIALTANTVGSGAGTISVIAVFTNG